MNACQTCLDGFAILGLGCSSCSNPFCQVCGFNANGTTCLTCINGYVSNAGICEQCSSKFPNCLACSLTSCNDCQPGSVISGIYCIPCSNFIPGCSLCSSTTTCSACEIDGYYFDSGASGASRCAVCLTSPLLTNCAVCEHEGNYCESCVPNFGLFGGVCLLCDNSFSNCAACNSTACLNCTSGFYFGNSGCSSCSLISPSCLNCNSTQCTLCDNGFYVNSSQCSPCSSTLVNCTSCSSASTCSSCIAGNVPILNGSSTSCVHCSALFVGYLNCDQSKCIICDYNEGYYRDANKTCTKCNSTITNCGKCNNFTVCEACTPTSALILLEYARFVQINFPDALLVQIYRLA